MKTVGPMFSLGASGTIGGVITMASWKGRPYARVRVTPSNPRSAAQTSNRAMMKFLSQDWAEVSDNDKESWAPIAQQGSFSPFNAFVKSNMNRWSQYLVPAENATAGTGGEQGDTPELLVTAGVKSISGGITVATGTGFAGAIIFLASTGTVSGLKSEVVQVIKVNRTGGSAGLEISGLKTGTAYTVMCRLFYQDGNFSPLSTVETATPS